MGKRKSNFTFAALCACALALAAHGTDIIIHLRNGDRVTGKISAETTTEVTLQSGALGKLVIPVGQILKREEIVAGASTNTVATTTSTNAPTTAKAPSTPAPKAAATKPAPPKHWNSEVQLGLNLRYTTTDQQEALAIAKTTYSKDHFREILDYNFTWGKTEQTQTANRMYGSSKTEYDLNPRWYAFGLVGSGYDEIRQIDLQVEADPGIGYNWIKKPDFVFKTEVGFGYLDQFFKGGSDIDTYSGRLAGIFTWKIYDKLTADGRLEYFPNLLSFHEYRFRGESTLRFPLVKNLSLNLNVIDIYDTQVPVGVQNNDLQLRSALGIKF
jgi:putative salt-induced outer membrane protein YdiY